MSSEPKQDLIFTKVIYQPGSISDEDLMAESDLQLDEGIKIIHVVQDDTLAPEKGSFFGLLSVAELRFSFSQSSNGQLKKALSCPI